MPKARQTGGVIAVMAVVAVFAFLAVRHNEAVGNQSAGTTTLPDQQYVSTTYGFSFTYPPEYFLKEYTPQYAEVGDLHTQVPLADITVEKSGPGTPFKSFDGFVEHQASLTCDADGPAGSVRCPATSRRDTFTTKTGIVGEIFYMEYVVVSGGATTTRESGPFYAFNISGNVAGSQYAALLIRPARPAEESAVYDAGALLAHALADSLKVSVLSP